MFSETQYPFIVSTKGEVIADDGYIQLIGQCNAVVQVSMVSPMYDRIEPGCPSYEERLGICRKVAPYSKRLIVRVQPYMTESLSSLLRQIPRLADAGVHGVILEGFKSVKAKEGLVKIGGDYAYPYDVLESHFQIVKDKAHENGLMFYSGENRLRAMGDSLTCCGCDGLDGFEVNHYNLPHIMSGEDCKPTNAMTIKDSCKAFSAMWQDTQSVKWLSERSFEQVMNSERLKNATEAALKRTRENPIRTAEQKLDFTLWLRSTGITPIEVDEITCTQMSSHWLCAKIDGQLGIPSPEQFEKLRKSEKVRDVPRYIEKLVYGD